MPKQHIGAGDEIRDLWAEAKKDPKTAIKTLAALVVAIGLFVGGAITTSPSEDKVEVNDSSEELDLTTRAGQEALVCRMYERAGEDQPEGC